MQKKHETISSITIMKQSSVYMAFFILFLFALTSSSVEINAQSKKTNVKKNSIVGTWEMKEVHWRSEKRTSSIEKAQPGMFIFTPNSYSIMWTPTKDPRTPFEKLSDPTDDELKSGFRSVVFNAGTYESTKSTITTTAMIAKVPGFEGGKQFYRYKINQDILTITMFDETYPDGTKPDWSGEWVTEFVLKRLE